MGQTILEKTEPTNKASVRESRYNSIMDASEQVFANSGYKGATLREIAERAGVAQGLIHYHFKTKEDLFEAMVARRSGHINDQRMRMLADLFDADPNPSLESIVEALFRPTIEAGLSQAGDGGAFARILVSTANSAGEWEQSLTEKYYDPVAKKYIAALMKVETELNQEDAVWAYMFAIGVGMTMMAKTGRPGRLSNGLCDDGDADVMLSKIIPFICAGIRTLTDQQK
jgi:AcrR family transcriptional regulator